MIAAKSITASGSLEIGNSKNAQLLHTICKMATEDGEPIELLISAAARHIWLTLDRETGLKLAELIVEHFLFKGEFHHGN